jgi:hypothetical protein
MGDVVVWSYVCFLVQVQPVRSSLGGFVAPTLHLKLRRQPNFGQGSSLHVQVRTWIKCGQFKSQVHVVVPVVLQVVSVNQKVVYKPVGGEIGHR